MQASAAIRWLPKLEKKPDSLNFSEVDFAIPSGEKKVFIGLFLIMQGVLMAVTGGALYNVAHTPTLVWAYQDALWLGIMNLYPSLLLGVILFTTKYNSTLCSQGHVTHRSSHSRYCHQCGLPLT